MATLHQKLDLGISWFGTAVTVGFAHDAQMWISMVAGTLTSIYTALRIYDWVCRKIEQRDQKKSVMITAIESE